MLWMISGNFSVPDTEKLTDQEDASEETQLLSHRKAWSDRWRNHIEDRIWYNIEE